MITVRPVNDLPVAVGDTASVDEGDALSIEASALLANDTDAENDTLSITAVGDAVNGTVSLDGTTISYTHDGSEATAGSFSYTISDGTDTDTATVTVTVSPVNDLPIAGRRYGLGGRGRCALRRGVGAPGQRHRRGERHAEHHDGRRRGQRNGLAERLDHPLHARRLRDDCGQLLLHRQRRRRHCHRHGGDYSSASGRCAGCRRREGHGGDSDTCGSRGNGAAGGRCARCGRREGHSHHSDACGSGNGESDTWVCAHTCSSPTTPPAASAPPPTMSGMNVGLVVVVIVVAVAIASTGPPSSREEAKSELGRLRAYLAGTESPLPSSGPSAHRAHRRRWNG